MKHEIVFIYNINITGVFFIFHRRNVETIVDEKSEFSNQRNTVNTQALIMI